ncbi:hypothetical protein HU200_052810 [Digitaria exilis]|uniref:Uncharacterized protein n=1 Tax=Digitaria exilis TaxID=1010633 RepID=A0A835AQH0_9POAL|nr:hypothetical protein HU200_052810 [Digitaria exilis]
MTAIVMLVLTMGQLMAEASPLPRRLLEEPSESEVVGKPGPGALVDGNRNPTVVSAPCSFHCEIYPGWCIC